MKFNHTKRNFRNYIIAVIHIALTLSAFVFYDHITWLKNLTWFVLYVSVIIVIVSQMIIFLEMPPINNALRTLQSGKFRPHLYTEMLDEIRVVDIEPIHHMTTYPYKISTRSVDMFLTIFFAVFGFYFIACLYVLSISLNIISSGECKKFISMYSDVAKLVKDREKYVNANNS